MGFLDRLRFVSQVAADPSVAPTFSSVSVDPAVFGISSYVSSIDPAPRISRREAIQCPAVKRCRDLVASTLGGLPLQVIDKANVSSASPFLDQPERAVARSVTMTRTFEDMLFEGLAWWRIVAFDAAGWPARIVRLDPRTVTVREDQRVYVRRDGSAQGAAMEYVEDAQLIRLDSANDPLLIAGARAIRTALKLDTTAGLYADQPYPLGFFTPREGQHDKPQAEVEGMLKRWGLGREHRATGYVDATLNYQTVQWDPEQLQLADARQHAVLEIARTAGVDPEDLGVSTTSRTYQNSVERRKALLDFTLGSYINAMQDRLSMPDVTRPGYRVRFDFNGFLRSDDLTRLQTYREGVDLGLYDLADVARREELPTPPGPPAQIQQETPMPRALRTVAASNDRAAITFDAAPVIAMETEASTTFSVDFESRTISGLACPFGVTTFSGGQKWQFSPGTISYGDPSRVKLLVIHQFEKAIGYAVKLSETAAGLLATFKVARGPEGDHALRMAEDGVWDGLSVGIGHDGTFDNRNGVNHAVRAPLVEISLTPSPAFDDARVSAVTASADNPIALKGGTPVPETVTPEAKPETPGVDFSDITDAIRVGFEALGPGPAREVIPAGGPLFVAEAAPYRFDRGGNLTQGSHDFSTDLFAGLRDGDREAYDRALNFTRSRLGPTFDTDMADGAALNPAVTRPELYVDQRAYRFPLLEATRAGGLADKTPFIVPTFNTATGLVAAHTEGVEPTPGTFNVTSATVTPGAVSGKVEITRELWDQGGTPQISGLIWAKMERAYYEGLEAKVVAVLNAASPTAINLTTGGGTGGATASAELATAFAGLQYVRGGFAFDTFAVQVDLYNRLASAVDTTGRPLFPIYNPMNANGQSAPRFGNMNVHGVGAFPEWALAGSGSVTAKSYLFDHESVRTWYSAPERLEFQYRVAYVDLAIWGYSVAAVLDLAGLRTINYDPV